MFAEVYKVDEHSLSFEIHDGKEMSYEIYMHQNAQICTDSHCLIANGKGSQTIVSLPSPLLPQYFTLKFENGETLLCGYRILPLQGMYNFRDMGGYPNKEGKRVKWGKLYRGDQ